MAKFEPILPPEGGFTAKPIDPPKCPVCSGAVCGYVEHHPPSTCIHCDPAHPKQHRRYDPCLHVVEIVDGEPIFDPICRCGVEESQHHTADPPHSFVSQGDVGRGCCTNCEGTGVDLAEPCFDCYGTGHPHPNPEDCTP